MMYMYSIHCMYIVYLSCTVRCKGWGTITLGSGLFLYDNLKRIYHDFHEFSTKMNKIGSFWYVSIVLIFFLFYIVLSDTLLVIC